MNQSFKTTGTARTDPLANTDLTDPAIVADPYPTYRRLQDTAPIAWNQQLNGWIVTRYKDVRQALQNPALSVEKLQPFVAHSSTGERQDVEILGEVLSDWMVFKDPPDHSKLRRALKDAFMPAEIKSLTPTVRATVDGLLEKLPISQPCEVVSNLAFPLPAMVIGDLFGLPRSELDRLKAWSDPLGRFVLGATDRSGLYPRAANAVREMKTRFHELVADHRRAPHDNFTSRMIANATDLSDDEIVHTLVLVLWAGHDTTTNLIATTLYHLCRNPHEFDRLHANPDTIPTAVEELLRIDGPAHMLVRLAKTDLAIGDTDVRAGERLFLMMNTANRDPAVFDHGDDLNLSREENRHLAFGRGVHMCLGAPLARLEGEQVLHGLTERFRSIRFGDEEPVWRQNLIMRGPSKLTAIFET